jgi:hypothetical protein
MMESVFVKYVLVVKIDAHQNNCMLIHHILILQIRNIFKNGMYKKHLVLFLFQIKFIMELKHFNLLIKEITLLKKYKNNKSEAHRNHL